MLLRKFKILPATILLAVYILSQAPAFILHFHHEDIISFAEADDCEKAVHYNLQDHHSQHLSKAEVKCWLCDHHTLAPQILFDSAYKVLLSSSYISYAEKKEKYFLIFTPSAFNKGPPATL